MEKARLEGWLVSSLTKPLGGKSWMRKKVHEAFFWFIADHPQGTTTDVVREVADVVRKVLSGLSGDPKEILSSEFEKVKKASLDYVKEKHPDELLKLEKINYKG